MTSQHLVPEKELEIPRISLMLVIPIFSLLYY